MITCPNCGTKGKSKVLDTRQRENIISRRRVCNSCTERFSTAEYPVDEDGESYKIKLKYAVSEINNVYEAVNKLYDVIK